MKKGMIVSILENKEIGNCSNGGISAHFNSVLLIGDNVPEIFEANERPIVKLVTRSFYGSDYIHAEPVNSCPTNKVGYMMGGCFIYSSDSRFSKLNEYPIPLHDRSETQDEYDTLSR